MREHRGGSEARPGFYWNTAKWSIAAVSRREPTLPGGPEARYVKLPTLVLLVVAPLMGGLYVMFLPFIGFALVLGFAGKKALVGLSRAAEGVVATMSPAWRPGEAYFAGKGKAGKGEKTEEEHEGHEAPKA